MLGANKFEMSNTKHIFLIYTYIYIAESCSATDWNFQIESVL